MAKQKPTAQNRRRGYLSLGCVTCDSSLQPAPTAALAQVRAAATSAEVQATSLARYVGYILTCGRLAPQWDFWDFRDKKCHFCNHKIISSLLKNSLLKSAFERKLLKNYTLGKIYTLPLESLFSAIRHCGHRILQVDCFYPDPGELPALRRLAPRQGSAKGAHPCVNGKVPINEVTRMANPNHSPHRTAPAELHPHLGGHHRASSNGDAAHKEQAAGRKSAPRPHRALPEEWAHVCDLALKQLNRCVSLEPKVLQGDNPDAVHDLRVATRRLQQVLDLMFPSPRPREIRRLRRRLKRCREVLSEVRNCDVLLDRVDRALASKRAARRKARSAIRQYLATRRAASFEKASRKLARANLSELYVRMKECLLRRDGNFSAGENGDQNPDAQTPSMEQFYLRVGENLKAVWGTIEEQTAWSQREPQAAVLHRVRISAKRMRYLVEVLHAFGVPGSAEVLIWLRSLQKHLGHWHDLVVFEDMAIEMIADPDFLRDYLELALDVERLILRNRALKAKLEEKYLEAIADQADLLRTKDWASRIIAAPAAVLTHA